MYRSELEELWAENEFNSISSSLDVMRDYVWQNLLCDAQSLTEVELKARLLEDFEIDIEEEPRV